MKKCWSCFKEKFICNYDNLFITHIKKIYPLAFVQSTFRIQKSIDWIDASLAFEKNLLEKEIKWFSYIKFYINNNNKILPLVSGKTGSLLVNSSGSDVNFSEDISHGPARKLLKENNLEWDKTQILIISANSENGAYIIKKYLKNNYNLLSS